MEEKKARLTRRYLQRPQEPLVSIIMPTFNRMNTISKALRSVRSQLYKHWELIVVDDGGTDDTKSVVERYNDTRIRYYRWPENKGASAARNQGMRMASGTYFAYLDSDNTWEPECLLLMVNTLVDHPGFLSLYAAQKIRKFHGLRTFLRFGVFHRALLENRNYIDLNIFLHHRDLYHRHGGFDETMRRLVDWELILRYTQDHFPLALDCVLGTYDVSWDFARISKSEDLHTNLTVVYSKLSAKPLRLSNLQAVCPSANCRFFSNMRSQIVHSGKAPPRIAIIIPSYEEPDSLKTCVEAIQTYTERGNYELIIVDNGSSRPVVEYLRSLQEKSQARVVFNSYNMGFPYAVNQGITLADPDRDVVIMNNDAIVTEGWLEAFAEVKTDVADVGIIAPRQVLPPFSKTMKTHVPFCLEEGELDVNLSQRHDNIHNLWLLPEKGYVELTCAPFFCVYITRSCLESVGLLDQKRGRRYASDRLYCEQVREQRQYRIVYTPHAKVYHLPRRSTAAPQKN
jgi:glycosyltransferase involved in cell wall biosynthesis